MNSVLLTVCAVVTMSFPALAQPCDPGLTRVGKACVDPARYAALKSSDLCAQCSFGASVSVSADGNTLAVLGKTAKGVTTIFVLARKETAWTEQAKLTAPGLSDPLGSMVVLSADGATLLLADAGESSDARGINGKASNKPLKNSGAVFAFTRSGTTWKQQAFLKSPTPHAYDHFGSAISLSNDGKTLAVFAEDSTGEMIPSTLPGIAPSPAPGPTGIHVYTQSKGTWAHESVITPVKDSGTRWTAALAFSADASTLAIASSQDSSGGVSVFTRVKKAWKREAELLGTAATNESFGNAVSMSNDGNTLAVGASGEKGDSGAVYVFARKESAWTQIAHLVATNADPGDMFGRRVMLTADGLGLVISAWHEDSSAIGVNGNPTRNDLLDSGAVYLFGRVEDSLAQEHYVKPMNGMVSGEFGDVMAMTPDGKQLWVGLPHDESYVGVDNLALKNAGAVGWYLLK